MLAVVWLADWEKFYDDDLRRIVNRDEPERRRRTDPTGPAWSQCLFYVISVEKICTRAHTRACVRARRKRQTKGHLQVDLPVTLPSLVSGDLRFAVSFTECHKHDINRSVLLYSV